MTSKRLLVLVTMACMVVGYKAMAQMFDYDVHIVQASTLTPDNAAAALNTYSVQGWDFYQAVYDASTGRIIVVYRRAHVAQ